MNRDEIPSSQTVSFKPLILAIRGYFCLYFCKFISISFNPKFVFLLLPKKDIDTVQLNNAFENAHQSEESPADREDLIWERFKSGDQRALTYIFEKYSGFLFNYGYQFTSNRNLIKDCLQDMFLDLIRHKRNLKPTDSIKFYLMKSFRNKLATTVEKNKRREKVELEKFRENTSFLVTISSEVKMINGQLDAEKRRLVAQKLNELPPLQREAILLYFYEGMKYAQIADLLGIKVKSTRSLIYRSLQSLKEILTPYKGVILNVVLILGLLI